jgi:hypothetical protein
MIIAILVCFHCQLSDARPPTSGKRWSRFNSVSIAVLNRSKLIVRASANRNTPAVSAFNLCRINPATAPPASAEFDFKPLTMPFVNRISIGSGG